MGKRKYPNLTAKRLITMLVGLPVLAAFTFWLHYLPVIMLVTNSAPWPVATILLGVAIAVTINWVPRAWSATAWLFDKEAA